MTERAREMRKVRHDAEAQVMTNYSTRGMGRFARPAQVKAVARQLLRDYTAKVGASARGR